MKKIIQILAVCALPALAVAQNTNVLRNPGFEYNPSGASQSFPGWTPFGQIYGANMDTNVWSESGAAAHGGANYIEVSPDLTTYQINFSGLYQDYMSGPGAVYSADGWVYAPSASRLAGQNSAWIEVTFRDANANVLALYRSSIVTNLAGGGFPQNTWVDLLVTNQYNPNTLLPTNTVSTLVAPAGAYFVRYEVVVRGDGNAADGGLVYFDDLRLASTGGTPYSGWNLAWSDEFNGTSVDPNTWTYDIGTGTGAGQPGQGWGNSELEYYTSRPNNVYEGGGLLHIIAQQESYGGANYTSARLKSQGLFSWLYGRIEWRAQLPAGSGCWPALWLLGTNIPTVPWPGCGEIDMMENRGSDSTNVQASTHSGGHGGSDGYGDDGGVYQFINGQETNAFAGFHTYAMDWSTNAIMFYTDGHLYATVKNWSSSVGSYPVPFNQPFFFIMNLAIGGSYLSWPSEASVNAGTPFPVEMDVDYLRVYQQTNTALVTVPGPTPPLVPSANSVLVDFDSSNSTNNTPSPTAGLYWNNVLIAQGGGGPVSINGSSQPMALVNAANANSGMTLAIANLTGWNSTADGWGVYTGTYGFPSVLGDIPITALTGGMLLNGAISVTLSGLNPGLTYNVLIYGATVDASTGNYTDLGNAQSNTLTLGASPSPATARFNAYYNSTMVGSWTNVTPSAGGQIALTITVPGGGSGGALNFLAVTPSTAGTGANPPSPPTGLGAAAGNGQVALTWTASAGATNYIVKRSNSSGAETNLASTASTSYTDTSVVNGTNYYYVVAAVNAYGTSGNSAEVSATPAAPSTSPPAAPVILTVTANSGQVSLTWSSVATATNYIVKRSTTSGAETNLASTASTSYTDTSVVNGTNYYYVVAAVNAYGTSGNSAEVSATPPIPSSPPPQGNGPTALLNFYGNSSYTVTSPDGNENYWNNIASGVNFNLGLNTLTDNGGTGSTSIALVGTTNGSSGWTLSISNWTGSGIQGDLGTQGSSSTPYATNLTAVWPLTALEDGLEIHYNAGLPGVAVCLSGLNPNDTYNVLLYGYAPGQNTPQTNVLAGGSSASPNPVIFPNVGINTNLFAEWDNITPTAGGQIIVSIAVGVEYSDGALNAMEVSQNTAATNPPAPAAPTILTVTTNSGQVSLTWSAVTNATSYNVKRSTVSGAETNLASTASTNCTDTSVVNGTTYYYVVSAVNSGGQSPNSAEVSATPAAPSTSPPATPTILTVTTNSGQVSLTWSAVATATNYIVKRSSTSGAETNLASTASTSYTDTSVVNGTNYYYVVAAVNAYGTSGNSGEVTATPPIPSAPPPQGNGPTALLNFSGTSGYGVASPDANSHYWNNLTGGAGNYGAGLDTLNNNGGSGSTSVALVTTTNGSPGWTLSISNWIGSGIQGDAGHGSSSTPYATNLTAIWPLTALEDGFDIHYNNGLPGVSVCLSGLKTSDTYNVLLYGYDPNQNGVPQTNVLAGGSSASPNPVIFPNVGINTNLFAEWDNITPTAGGQIILNIICGKNYQDCALNAMELAQNTPTPTVLGGITRGVMSGNSLTLNWTASANVYLQSATNLTPPVVWTDLTNTTGQGSAAITTTNTHMFFRLVQP